MDKKEIFNMLNASYHATYEYELFTDRPRYDYWKLTDVLRTVPGVPPVTYRNKFTLRAVFDAHTPKRLFPKNPDKSSAIFDSNVYIFDWKKFDAELSRYACWTLMKEIAKETPTEFQQEYFMNPNGDFADIFANASAAARIRLRATVADYQRQLSGIIGRLTGNQSVLMREMYSWLFPNDKISDIQMRYRMNESKPLADYMNARLLYAYGLLLKKIVNRWDGLVGIRTYSQLRDIVRQESVLMRREFCGLPEHNFDMSSIANVEQWRSAREYEFAKKCIVMSRER